jgi:hypothetical protein
MQNRALFELLAPCKVRPPPTASYRLEYPLKVEPATRIFNHPLYNVQANTSAFHVTSADYNARRVQQMQFWKAEVTACRGITAGTSS